MAITGKTVFQRRGQALQAQSPARALSTDYLAARIHSWELAQQQREANQLLTGPITIYCAKTGQAIGQFWHQSMVELTMLPNNVADDNYAAFESRRYYHPAWLNTSPEILQQLQTMFPHEWLVWAAYELQSDNYATDGATRNQVLQFIKQFPLAEVIEAGELVRRMIAIVGRYIQARKQNHDNRNKRPIGLETATAARDSDADIPLIGNINSLAEYITNLRAAFGRIIAKLQAEHHFSDVYRARQVSLQDIRRVSITVGRSQFKAARVAVSNLDNAAFSDVAEIFADFSEFEMTISAKHSEARRGMKYTGNVYNAATVNAGIDTNNDDDDNGNDDEAPADQQLTIRTADELDADLLPEDFTDGDTVTMAKATEITREVALPVAQQVTPAITGTNSLRIRLFR